jgi:hypothetical protein
MVSGSQLILIAMAPNAQERLDSLAQQVHEFAEWLKSQGDSGNAVQLLAIAKRIKNMKVREGNN